MKQLFENILLIAGSGRNVGKTTFACEIIRTEKEKDIYAVKITPHFHEPTPGLIEIEKGENWIIYDETNSSTKKDSSLFLQNGAKKSFLIQSKKENLGEVFNALRNYLPENNPVIIESSGLLEIIKPGLLIFILPDGECQKKEIESRLEQADLIVISDGKKFYPPPEKISFTNKWELR
ncbi:MAG: hypothetical protein HN778_21645 [Prolixibacteraceae bacterium]|jgi:hypothetical protein|nr:hypothetical protein [Prolixibacteraceae bacterium]MBT6006863.1 hypothetical protein [Prolixibacteraceae bacterium]MBT6766050.1 hypothetical protein [Prolixibacteraceae bacterium]MBT6998640.1 hypothetical protein [Prolixibacteraceae bacterium]MBT7397441.1 hypothetical protein [Prolixibacteraceae bacterium]